MAFIKKLVIKNFKCFRVEQIFEINQSNYFIGKNNSGKSAILQAIYCFFDDNAFQDSFINRTVLKARQEGYNRSEISISFNIDEIKFTNTRTRYTKKFGKTLTIKKTFTVKDVTSVIEVRYI